MAETSKIDPTKLDYYVKSHRDLVALIVEKEAANEKALKPLRDLKASLEGWLGDFLTVTGMTNAQTPFGTVHWNTRWTTSVKDGEAFMKHVLETGQFELLERRANATAVKEYAGQHGTLPPGVSLNPFKTIGVNKPGAKFKERTQTNATLSAAATAAVTE